MIKNEQMKGLNVKIRGFYGFTIGHDNELDENFYLVKNLRKEESQTKFTIQIYVQNITGSKGHKITADISVWAWAAKNADKSIHNFIQDEVIRAVVNEFNKDNWS